MDKSGRIRTNKEEWASDAPMNKSGTGTKRKRVVRKDV